MQLTTALWAAILACLPAVQAAAESTKEPEKPCTVHSPLSGSFFDLRPLQLTLDGTKYQAASNESYHSKGWDYGANFTMNFCGAVVEELDEVEGIPAAEVANISAYYKDHRGDVYSIGRQNDEPIFRGKKLVLNYTMGSPCPDLDQDGHPLDSRAAFANSLETRRDKPRRKSTILSFICDTSPILNGRPTIAFVGSLDHCTYSFEVRSRYGCAGATPSPDKGTLGPGGVFGVIFGIAIAVYLVGGIVYQRTVMHQRGWRQLPNYPMWSGMFSFISDMSIILCGSCFQRMPSATQLFGGRRGYHRLGAEDRDNTRGRTPDDENRLIDQLDEEWED